MILNIQRDIRFFTEGSQWLYVTVTGTYLFPKRKSVSLQNFKRSLPSDHFKFPPQTHSRLKSFNLYFTMREVISLHVGQAGVQIGNACCESRYLGPVTCIINLDNNQQGNFTPSSMAWACVFVSNSLISSPYCIFSLMVAWLKALLRQQIVVSLLSFRRLVQESMSLVPYTLISSLV